MKYDPNPTWRRWRTSFERAATRPVPPIAAPELSVVTRAGVLESLQKFQIGESGEGRVAHEIDSARWPGIDDDFRQSLKMLVREEGRHSRMLALMVHALGGRTLSRNWSERLFVFARRALGLRFKLLVLLSVEVIGVSWYGLLAEQLPAGPLCEALRQMCTDEERHLAFFTRLFATQRWRWARWVWRPLNIAAGVLVVVDHRRTLRALNVPWREAFGRMWSRVNLVASGLAQSTPAGGVVLNETP